VLFKLACSGGYQELKMTRAAGGLILFELSGLILIFESAE
jgi:hypothetical protein